MRCLISGFGEVPIQSIEKGSAFFVFGRIGGGIYHLWIGNVEIDLQRDVSGFD